MERRGGTIIREYVKIVWSRRKERERKREKERNTMLRRQCGNAKKRKYR